MRDNEAHFASTQRTSGPQLLRQSVGGIFLPFRQIAMKLFEKYAGANPVQIEKYKINYAILQAKVVVVRGSVPAPPPLNH